MVFGYRLYDRNNLGVFVGLDLALQARESDIQPFLNNNQLSIDAEGSGSGVLKIGLGFRYVPYISKRWSIHTELSGGILNARAGGGTDDVSINSIDSFEVVERKEKTGFLELALGSNYRISSLFLITGSLQGNLSSFKNDIGSVSGVTGWSINLGVGITIPVKKE